MASFLVLLGSDKGDVAYFVSLRSSLCILHTSSWVAPSGKFLMGPKVSRDLISYQVHPKDMPLTPGPILVL